MKRLNHLLGFIKEVKPEKLSTFVENLSKKYQKLTSTDSQADGIGELSEHQSQMTHLEEHTTLIESALNYFLQVLQLPEGFDWKKEKIEVTNRNYLRLYLHPRYYNVQTLTETIDRADAISMYKRYVTEFLKDTRELDRKTYESLEALFEERKKPRKEPSDWEIVFGMIADGKYAYRNDNCLWVDALEDLEDSELKYYVCCYGDYENAKRYHDGVILTMEHTIAGGDPYCSRVLHDTRVDWDLRHPPKKFWDDLTHSAEVEMEQK
ncbi:MAG: L-2-amino-thiazoline-4-carboxylic acid hydrolase [Candidatus Thorarchaeota archaeon]